MYFLETLEVFFNGEIAHLGAFLSPQFLELSAILRLCGRPKGGAADVVENRVYSASGKHLFAVCARSDETKFLRAFLKVHCKFGRHFELAIVLW